MILILICLTLLQTIRCLSIIWVCCQLVFILWFSGLLVLPRVQLFLIVHICSSNNELLKKTGIILNDISDKFQTFVCFDLTVQKPHHFFKCTRRVSNYDCVIMFQNKLINSRWSSLYTPGKVDEMYDSFYENLFRICEECLPIVTRLKKNTLLRPISELNLNVWSIRKKLERNYYKKLITHVIDYGSLRSKFIKLTREASYKFYRYKLNHKRCCPKNFGLI